MRRSFRCALPILTLCALFTPALARSEDASEYERKGISALKESQSDPRIIVEAARDFALAAAAYEKAGDTNKTTEMNSFLYWCKKKMNLADIESFVKGDEKAVA